MHSWEVEILALGSEGGGVANAQLNTQDASLICVGVARCDANLNDVIGADGRGWGLLSNGHLWWGSAGCDESNGSINGVAANRNGREATVKYGEQLYAGDTVGVELDLDLGTLRFFHNGRDLGVAFGPAGSGAAVVSSSRVGGSDVKMMAPPGSDSSGIMGEWAPFNSFGPLFPAVSLMAPGTSKASQVH